VISLIAAVVVGLGLCICAAAPASATTASAMTQPYTAPPSPLSVMMTPLTVGLHVIDAIAQGIADAVEFIATPEPIAIPAPHIST
jgi:hypothetical protein